MPRRAEALLSMTKGLETAVHKALQEARQRQCTTMTKGCQLGNSSPHPSTWLRKSENHFQEGPSFQWFLTNANISTLFLC